MKLYVDTSGKQECCADNEPGRETDDATCGITSSGGASGAGRSVPSAGPAGIRLI
jgi:hypothetical protein